jgi:pantoate--beta-alanine ligase
MSSRNAYLSPNERKRTLVLYRALTRVQEMVEAGERDAGRLVAAGREEFSGEDSVRIDYFEIVNPETLDPVVDVSQGALVAVAAYVGNTRLIDNLVIGNAVGKRDNLLH